MRFRSPLTALLLVLLTAMKELPATLMLRPTGMDTLATELSADNRAAALKLAQVAESIRGYGHVKAASMERARVETARLLQEFRQPATAPMKEIALLRMDR